MFSSCWSMFLQVFMELFRSFGVLGTENDEVTSSDVTEILPGFRFDPIPVETHLLNRSDPAETRLLTEILWSTPKSVWSFRSDPFDTETRIYPIQYPTLTRVLDLDLGHRPKTHFWTEIVY